jgi:hypothetical protein
LGDIQSAKENKRKGESVMSVGLYLRSFCGFALQLVPCAMLLPVPFREEAFAKGKRWAYAWLAALALVFSLC